MLQIAKVFQVYHTSLRHIVTVQLKGNLVYYTRVSILLHVPPFACACIHVRQSITVTGNDAGYSPPSSVLHAGLYG